MSSPGAARRARIAGRKAIGRGRAESHWPRRRRGCPDGRMRRHATFRTAVRTRLARTNNGESNDCEEGELLRPPAHPQVLRAHHRSGGDAEPDRGSEVFLRPVPDGRGAGRRARRRGTAGGLQVGVPDLRLRRQRHARIRALRVRSAEIRRRGMPAARHDLRGAAQGDAAPDRVRRRPGDRREVGQGYQGAGRLHGRHAAHDGQRHLHHQRHRARHRLADAPLAGRLLRPRQGQDAFLRQAALRGAHHPLSRLLARHRVRRQGHRARAHRPAPQDPGDVAADGARHGRRGDPLHLLRVGHRHA